MRAYAQAARARKAVKTSPFTVLCAGCDAVIHRGRVLEPLDTILNRVKGRCPDCDAELTDKPRELWIQGERIPLLRASRSEKL